MKKINEKYFTIAVYVLITAFLVLLFGLLIFNLSGFVSLLGQGIRAVSAILYAILFALLLLPLVKFCERLWDKAVSRKKARPRLAAVLGIVTAYFFTIVILGVVFGALIPALISNIDSFGDVFTSSVQTVLAWFESNLAAGSPLQGLLQSIGDYLTETLFNMDLPGNLVSRIGSILSGLLSAVSNIFMGAILSVYIVASRRMLTAIISKIIVAIIPEKAARRLVIFAKRLYTDFCTYSTARLTITFIFAVGAFLVLWLLKIPMFSLIVALLLFSYIFPVIGPILGITVAVALCFFLAPARAWIVLLALIGIAIFCSRILLPLMTPHKLRPSFALVAALVIVGGGLFGLIGAFLALPVYTTVSVEVRELLVRRLNKKNLPVSNEAYMNTDISTITATHSAPKPDENAPNGEEAKDTSESADQAE